MHFSKKKKTKTNKRIQETLGNPGISLRIQENPQKKRDGQLRMRLALLLVSRSRIKTTSRKSQAEINRIQEFQK